MTQKFHYLGIWKKKKRNTNWKRYMHTNVHSSIVYNCQDMEVSINWWTCIKMWYIYVYIYMYIYVCVYIYICVCVCVCVCVCIHTQLGHKKEWNFAICNNMDGPGGYYACEISQIGKDKHYMSSLTCGIYKKKKEKECI